MEDALEMITCLGLIVFVIFVIVVCVALEFPML